MDGELSTTYGRNKDDMDLQISIMNDKLVRHCNIAESVLLLNSERTDQLDERS